MRGVKSLNGAIYVGNLSFNTLLGCLYKNFLLSFFPKNESAIDTQFHSSCSLDYENELLAAWREIKKHYFIMIFSIFI